MPVVRAVLRALFRSAKPPGPLFRGVIGPGRAVQPYLIALVVASGAAWLGALSLSHVYRMAPAVGLALAGTQAAPLLLAVNRPLASWWLMTAAQAAAWPLQLSALHTHGHAGWPWPAAVFVGQTAVLVALTVHERVATLLAV